MPMSVDLNHEAPEAEGPATDVEGGVSPPSSLVDDSDDSSGQLSNGVPLDEVDATTPTNSVVNPEITVTVDGVNVSPRHDFVLYPAQDDDVDPIAAHFTNSTRSGILSPIISEVEWESSPRPAYTMSFHKDSDLYIKSKDKLGANVVFEVTSFVLVTASPVFRQMLYGPSHRRPEVGNWVLDLSMDNAKALRFIFRFIHFQVPTRDSMRKRTRAEIFDIISVADKYELDCVICNFAKKWSAEYVVGGRTFPGSDVQKLWVSWKLADFKVFLEMFRSVAFSTTLDQDGALFDSAGKPLANLQWSKQLLDVLYHRRLAAVYSVLNSLSQPIAYFMSEDVKPDGRYCKSTEHQLDCHSTLLGSAITALVKAKMWPLPKPEEYRGSVNDLCDTVSKLHITALIYHGRPPHEQRHMRCGLKHLEAIDNLQVEVPALSESVLTDLKHRGLMMGTFDEQAWAPYNDRDDLPSFDEWNMEADEDDAEDNGWNE